MALNGISSKPDFLVGFSISKGNRKQVESGLTEVPDIDREENDKLASKMYLAATKSDAAAAYFGTLQEAVKDSKNGFEANRRVNKLTSTHEQIVSSKEYANKKDANSVVKDLNDAIEEKRKEIDELVDKRKEKEESNASDNAGEETAAIAAEERADGIRMASDKQSSVKHRRSSSDKVDRHGAIVKKYALNMHENEYKNDPSSTETDEGVSIDEIV